MMWRGLCHDCHPKCVICDEGLALFAGDTCASHAEEWRYREPWWLRALRWVAR